ncbi:MAG: hypothetical protein ACFE8O_09005 [Candidatus Hermodarchaeota archaeon]
MKKQLEVGYVLISGQILVRLDSQQFQEIVAEEELRVISGYIKRSIFRYEPPSYYYFASNGTLTYYLRVGEPIDEIIPDIVANRIQIQFHPPRQNRAIESKYL